MKKVKNPFHAINALYMLKNYSLVSGSDISLSIHHLVQIVTLDSLGLDEHGNWAGSVLRFLNDVLPEKGIDATTWPTCIRLFPHPLTVSIHAESLDVLPEINIQLLDKLGGFLFYSAQCKKAENLFERALKIIDKHRTKLALEVAPISRAMGKTLEAMDTFRKAEKMFDKAL